MTTQAGAISCLNEAGFVMNFWIEYINPGTGAVTSVNGSTTGNYPVGQVQSVFLSQFSIPEGAQVRPHVQAILGKDCPGPFVIYVPNGGGAMYVVQGTTLDITVNGPDGTSINSNVPFS